DRQDIGARTHTQFEPGRLPSRELTHARDEFDEFDRGREHLVRRRAHTLDAHEDAAGRRDLRIHLRRRKHRADAGFGTLAELEGHTLHLVPGTLIAELSRTEIAVLGAGTEVPGSDLPDQVTAMLEMIGRDPALAGVMGEP